MEGEEKQKCRQFSFLGRTPILSSEWVEWNEWETSDSLKASNTFNNPVAKSKYHCVFYYPQIVVNEKHYIWEVGEFLGW